MNVIGHQHAGLYLDMGQRALRNGSLTPGDGVSDERYLAKTSAAKWRPNCFLLRDLILISVRVVRLGDIDIHAR